MPRQQSQWHFFVDQQRYETPNDSLSGAEIKKIARCAQTALLFLESLGDLPDRVIGDAEHVHMTGRVKHFYAVR